MSDTLALHRQTLRDHSTSTLATIETILKRVDALKNRPPCAPPVESVPEAAPAQTAVA